MSRRSLRRAASEPELSLVFREFEALPRPWNAMALFGREAPLEVEVGSGKGLFLATAAAAAADRNFLGIELARKYAMFAAARLAKLKLEHARLVHGDGLALVRDVLPTAGVSAVHVYFPDPWWKKRHHKRRIMTAEFLSDVARVLMPGGWLHFWTDVEEYFQTTLPLVAENGQFGAAQEVAAREASHDLDYRTHFERRMRLGGQPIYRAQFARLPLTADG